MAGAAGTLAAEALCVALGVALGGRRVLVDVDARFQQGRVTAVLGPNGAGKSTLLACLAGLRRPSSGRVLIDGVPRESLPARDLARRIGYLPQTADVHWDVDVKTLVALGRYPHRGRWGESAADRAAVATAMAATDVEQFASRPVASLSGGERARVLLARVLAGEPDWLLADEPLANLDPAHQHDALACLARIAAAGTGVIVVLHDLDHALRAADDVLLLADGAVAAHGPPAAVLTPERIAEVYGVAAHIGALDDGRRFLVTTARARR
jgi:iron complex transport system ATP-binding protein